MGNNLAKALLNTNTTAIGAVLAVLTIVEATTEPPADAWGWVRFGAQLAIAAGFALSKDGKTGSEPLGD